MWWRVKFVVVVWVCVADLSSAQQNAGVPLPGLPTQQTEQNAGVPLSNFPSRQTPVRGAGVPLPHPPNVHPAANFGPVSHGDSDTVVVTLGQDSGVPLPRPGAGGIVRQSSGVPLPAAGGTVQQSSGGVPLPAAGGVPLPTAGGTVQQSSPGVPLTHLNTGVPLPGVVPQSGGGVPLPAAGGAVPQSGGGVPLLGGVQQSGGVPLPLPGAGITPHERASVGGGIPGGLRSVLDPELDADVQRVVRLAVVQGNLQLKSRADKAVKISNIVTAHKQVVAGQLVYLTLRVGETSCPVGTPDLHVCGFDTTEDTYICEIVVWERPWLNTSKIIDDKSRCAETEDDNDFDSWGVFSHPVPSPSEVSLDVLPEGINEQQLSIEAFNYIDHGSESKFRGELISYDINNIKFDSLTNTTKVQVNVEYGFNLCLKSPNEKTDPRICPKDVHRDHYICSVIVIHNPNQISGLEVVPILEDDDDIHCQRKRSVEEELVVPVHASCLGCPQPAPLNDPIILEIADYALKEYDRTADEDELHLVLRLIKAQTQVVNGVKYYLTLELAESDCRKTLTGVDVNRTFCTQDPTEDTKICDLHVVDQPWVPARDLVAAQCYDKDEYPTSTQDEFIVPVALGTGLSSTSSSSGSSFSTSSLLGSEKPLEIDGQTMEIVQMIVKEYNRREDDSEYYKLVKVHEASKQVVSGTKYDLVIELGETNCHKFDQTIGNGDRCILDPTEEHEVCKAEVHEQAWLQNEERRKILSLTCDDLDDYLRQKLLPTHISFDLMDHPFLDDSQDSIAGFRAVAKNDSVVQEAAAFIVDQYNLRGDEDELYAFTKVVSAHLQDVTGGIKYHLEVEIAETRCKKYLPVSDPSRCPLDHGEEREICQAEVLIPQASGSDKQLTKLFCDEQSDYYTRRIRGRLGLTSTFSQQSHGSGALGGVWTEADINDKRLQKLGHLIADEFDARSDEDNLFIFKKLSRAQKQVAGGVRYHLVVELEETVCPKYKRHINKTRCAPDIGEEPMICEAHILSQPWLKKQEVTDLRCAEKDDFMEADESIEVLYPNVHPTAHARPVFRSHFIVRSSDESDESNERFYDPSRRTESNSYESNEDDSDERFYHPSGRVNSHFQDSDEDDDSDELTRFRGKRTSGLDPLDSKVTELAEFAVRSVDALSEDPNIRVVEKVMSAAKKAAIGAEWKLEVVVSWTACRKEDQIQDISNCKKDPKTSSSICNFTVSEDPLLNYRKVVDMKCNPLKVKQ
ncbi:uncharacterized protein [Panulirus ornatus]|uniref:uncharacterized protein isoform X2 n=1 Tax=Panulirus ornatus TaxID=150431 RepID=UPI003A8511CD